MVSIHEIEIFADNEVTTKATIYPGRKSKGLIELVSCNHICRLPLSLVLGLVSMVSGSVTEGSCVFSFVVIDVSFRL